MRINKSAVAAASAIAFAGIMGTLASVAVAEEAHHSRAAHARTGMVQHQPTLSVNSGRHSDRRNYSENHYDNDGNRHRRHRGFGGISINLGDMDSSCRYSYRKWQATGSRYWRSRYYDCIG